MSVKSFLRDGLESYNSPLCMRKLYIFMLLLFMGLCGHAQVGGKHVYSFLNLAHGPRQSALGGKAITLYDYDPSGAILNPASINKEMHHQVSLNYTSYFADVNYGTASYAMQIGNTDHVIHTGVTYINYGTFDGYDETGIFTEKFSGGDVALSLGYAYQIANSDFHIGANAKFISSKLEQYSSLGIAMDIGIIYLAPNSGLRISAVARNIGTQLKPYHEIYESLPFEVILGISNQLENLPLRWHITLDNLQQWDIGFSNPNRGQVDLDGTKKEESVSFLNNALRHMILGVELFPESTINLRLGYNFRRGEELRIEEQRAFAGLNAGFGIKFNSFRVSYAYAKYSAAAASNYFGLNINF